MKRIIMDTNFLMIPFQFRVDIFSELGRICNFNYKLLIFEQSINELKKIIELQAGREKRAAQFALKLIKLKNIEVVEAGQKDVDSLILGSLTKDNAKDTIIATQDLLLKKEVLKKGASAVILRQKKYLQLIEGKLYK